MKPDVIIPENEVKPGTKLGNLTIIEVGGPFILTDGGEKDYPYRMWSYSCIPNTQTVLCKDWGKNWK